MRFALQRPECESAMEFLWEYLDAELTPDAARIVGAHFERCERCAPSVRSSLRLMRAVRLSGAGVRAPAELRARMVAGAAARH